MFLTVTFNPALDKTLFVDRNDPRDTLRAARVIDLAGGKGINVSRALKALGGASRALAPLAGHPGAQLADLARAEGLAVTAVPVSGRTRSAITVREARSGQYWHYLEPGPQLTALEIGRLLSAFEQELEGCHTAILSGSLPSPAVAPAAAEMVRMGRSRGVRVALDSFGPLLRPAMEAGPWMAKPNECEWSTTWDERADTEAARLGALERMAGFGIEYAVLSLGEEGALAIVRGERYRIMPPAITEVNDLGSGDSFVAGICWAAAQGYNTETVLAWGAACGAANAAVWDPGAIDRAEVERLLPQVRITRRK